MVGDTIVSVTVVALLHEYVEAPEAFSTADELGQIVELPPIVTTGFAITVRHFTAPEVQP